MKKVRDVLEQIATTGMVLDRFEEWDAEGSKGSIQFDETEADRLHRMVVEYRALLMSLDINYP